MRLKATYSIPNTVKLFMLAMVVLLGTLRSSAQITPLQLQSSPQEQVVTNGPSHLPAKILPATPKTNARSIGRANYASFNKRVINKTDEVLQQNKGYEQHSELGMLPANAPCKDCYEVIGNRTENSKTYALSGTNGKKVVIQYSNFPMHYRDEKGSWSTIENELHADISQPKVFATKHQPVYIKIDADLGYSTISRDLDGNSIANNRNLELFYIKPDGTEKSLGNANWKNFTAGDNGVIVKGAWPGIDIEMTVKPNGVETNFYINNALPAYSDGKLVLRDHIQMSKGLSLFAPSRKDYVGDIKLIDQSGEEFFNIGEAIAYEEHDAKSSLKTLNYSISDKNVLDISIPGNFLNRPSTSYPIVIDPAVTITSIVPVGPRFSPYTNYCVGNNNVAIPAGYTITDIQAAYAYYSPTGLVPDLMYGFFNFRVGACTSPNPALYIGYACTGSTALYCGGPPALDLLPDVAACIPAMSCTATTLNVQVGCSQDWAFTANCSATYFNTYNTFPYTVYVYANTGGTLTPILGPSTVCVGGTMTLTDVTGGGAWSSGTTSVATIDPVTGKVTGISPGTTLITYTVGGCSVTTTITVLASSPILGNLTVCQGSTTLLSDALTPGTWSSTATTVATVNPASGLVGGVSLGTSIISYVLTSTGCTSTAIVTVTPPPTAILGNLSVCSGSTTTLSDLVTGGGWLSSNPAVASIGGASGIVSGSGIVTATSIITYTLGSCSVTATVTVNPSPAVISGTPNVCSGLTVTVSDAVAGGTWSSSNTGVATISGTGVITGVGAGGTAVITYMMPGNCYATIIATVNPAPSSILGNPVVCQGLTTSLSNMVGGGAWSSSTTSVATIDPVTGLVTGIGPGTSTIQYLSTNCNPVTIVVTVNPVQPILGTPIVCAGLSITLSDLVPGGTWSSSLTSVATIVSGTGFVNGVSAGNSTIVYTTPANCTTSVVLTVNPSPVAITGTTSLCLGQVAIMSDGTLGGTWSSSNTAVATIISGSGFTSAVGTGTTSIIYTLPAGCTATMTLSVNPLPGAINGNTQVCAGLTDDLTDVTGGGSWSSSNTTAAIIDPVTGVVNAESAGITTITYLLPTGCSATMVLTVNPSPVAITGNFNLCVGLSNQLTDGSAGGTWSSSNTSIASIIPATGVATGVSTGTATITYTLSAGCTATSNVTVYPVPGAINGATSACIGNTTTLTDGTGGGTWTSSATAVATIGITSGLVNAVTAGTTTITYSLTSTGCYASTVFTVNPPPAAISGTANICQGSSVTFTDGTGGGNWSSSNSTIASVSPTGLVTGVLPGTVNISYTLPTTCYSIFSTTIEAAPTAINGSGTVCVGSAVTLTDAVTGGTWSIASGSGTAAISSASGIVTGLTPGTVIVTYATCSPVSTVMSVNPLPSAILGEGSVCEGSSTTVSDGTPGGAWSISPGASISATGVITGISTAGAVIVTYTLPTSCFITVPISVSPIPSPIQGVDSVCPGSSVILTDATADGVWSSSDGTIAHATAFTGEILGMVHGDVTITYSLVSGCYTVTPFHVETPIPVFLSVTTNPIDTFLCTDVPVTLTAVVTPAVGSPTFQWEIFGSYVGAGSTYTYNPLHADFITCLMTMNGACTSPSAINKDVTLNVWPLAGPTVVVTCTQPDTAAYMGEVYTFYTTVTFGGPNPSYQWYINNAPVGGATHPVFTTPVYNENDSVYCVVNGNSPCDTGSYVGTSNGKIIYGQGWLSVNNIKTGSNDLSLFPNPNTGSFTLSGTITAGQDKEVTLEVTDMLGRTVYTGKTIPQNGTVKAEIKLDNEAAGSYLLRASTESGTQTFHFVIQ